MSEGLLAEFIDQAALSRAEHRLQEAELGALETYTPVPPESDPPRSAIPLVILAAGLAGAAAAFLLQTYARSMAYPVNVGGRPHFAWPAYVPWAFETGVLCAVVAGFVSFLIANRLPALYDPIDEIGAFRRASRDGYFLALRTRDGAALDRARALLAGLQPRGLFELPEEPPL